MVGREENQMLNDSAMEMAVVLKKTFGRKSIQGAEVGAQIGMTSNLLLRYCPNLRMLYMIDIWKGCEPDSDYAKSMVGVGRPLTWQDDETMLLACLSAQERTVHAAARRQICRGTSEEWASVLADDFLDFVFIDADHTFEGCLADIRLWYPKVKRGGLVFGHDYDPKPPVKAWGARCAVEQFQRERGSNAVIHTGADTVWWFFK